MDRVSHSTTAVSSAHKTSLPNLHRRSLKTLKSTPSTSFSFTSSATHSAPSSRPLPLTKENLMLVTDETEQPANVLIRYYNGMATVSTSTSSTSTSSTSFSSSSLSKSEKFSTSHIPVRRRERRPSSMDAVMQSPRLLPFPYHNDSLFLPTAEQSHRPSTTNSPNSSLLDISIPPSQQNQFQYQYKPADGSTPAPSRRSSATDHRRPVQVPQAPRRQSSAPGSFNKARIAFTKKNRTSKRKSAPAGTTVQMAPSLDTSSNNTSDSNSSTSDPCEPESPTWISRALKFFSKRKTAPLTATLSAAQQPASKVCRFSEQPVWYSQYANNPRPTPIVLVSQSMAAAA
ncbi:hypothetical protein J3Q64DRAFT_1199559 [Phycomyces blakesleeanus]|uniref:Uncharacterized protein n=1 Tax=Phycomyces blakesleeanus TaxID=4837 RepID=A0ABR3AR60_PHYBL